MINDRSNLRVVWMALKIRFRRDFSESADAFHILDSREIIWNLVWVYSSPRHIDQVLH